MAQLAADCGLLEELRVMDYSLLLGVHRRSAEGYTSTELVTDRVRARARRPAGRAGPPDAACAHGRYCASAGRPACLSVAAWRVLRETRKAHRGLRLQAAAPRAQEDEGEDEADTPLAAGPGGFWAPVGRLSADLRPPARHSSAEGAPGGSPARSPVRGGSAVNDLDAAWARVQARGPAARLGGRGAWPRTPARARKWRSACVSQDLPL
jgi:hypothetical protein